MRMRGKVMKRLGLLLFLTLVSCTRPDRSGRLTERYRYDSSGRLVEYTAADGAATRYSYDPAGRLTSASFSGGRVEYGYDSTGARAWMKDSTGTTEYYRDALGRVSDVIWRHGRWRLIHYQQDPWGNVTEIRVANLDVAGTSAGLLHALEAFEREELGDAGLLNRAVELDDAHFVAQA